MLLHRKHGTIVIQSIFGAPHVGARGQFERLRLLDDFSRTWTGHDVLKILYGVFDLGSLLSKLIHVTILKSCSSFRK